MKCRLNFKRFEKNDDPHRFWISEITDFENVVRWMSKNSRFTGPFHRQHGKLAKTLLKYASLHLYHIYWSLSRKLCCKKSLLLICQTLRLFVIILTADDKYPVLKSDKLMIPIQMQLSQKQKTFSWCFSAWTLKT